MLERAILGNKDSSFDFNPVVSVITAVYNDETFILESIESILKQTFTDFEYIIVDDGSTDNTLKILREVAKKDKRIIVLTQSNQGPAKARNYAIKEAKGKYIALQDSDDISAPERLQLQLKQLQNLEERTICCADYNIISENGDLITSYNKVYKDITAKILNGSQCVCHASIMISKKALIKAKGYNDFYKKGEDYDLLYKLLELGGRIKKVNQCLYSVRIRPDSETSMNKGMYTKRMYANHKRRLLNQPEDFSEVVNDNKKIKNYYIKRIGNELFYSEQYSSYRMYYLKHFYRLPYKHILFFLFSFMPRSIQEKLKSN